MTDKLLYSPKGLNAAFKSHLKPLGWDRKREKCSYSSAHYAIDYEVPVRVRKLIE